MEFGGRSAPAGFLVLKECNDQLIGCKTALDLNIIQFVNKINDNMTEDKVKEIVRKFPNTFSGKPGCIKNVEITLDVDPDIKPVRQPQRPVAIHLRDAVERELKAQVAEDIMEQIDSTSGPTLWVANLVVVPKGKPTGRAKCGSSRMNGKNPEESIIDVRLTCDSRAQNKAIRRTRYPGRTIEDMVAMVNGAKVFS